MGLPAEGTYNLVLSGKGIHFLAAFSLYVTFHSGSCELPGLCGSIVEERIG